MSYFYNIIRAKSARDRLKNLHSCKILDELISENTGINKQIQNVTIQSKQEILQNLIMVLLLSIGKGRSRQSYKF